MAVSSVSMGAWYLLQRRQWERALGLFDDRPSWPRIDVAHTMLHAFAAVKTVGVCDCGALPRSPGVAHTMLHDAVRGLRIVVAHTMLHDAARFRSSSRGWRRGMSVWPRRSTPWRPNSQIVQGLGAPT